MRRLATILGRGANTGPAGAFQGPRKPVVGLPATGIGFPIVSVVQQFSLVTIKKKRPRHQMSGPTHANEVAVFYFASFAAILATWLP
jgi:hypothetical protein